MLLSLPLKSRASSWVQALHISWSWMLPVMKKIMITFGCDKFGKNLQQSFFQEKKKPS